MLLLGGNVTVEDFNRYEPRVYEDRFMIRLDEHYRLYTVPPPSSGVLVSSIMRIMKGWRWILLINFFFGRIYFLNFRVNKTKNEGFNLGDYNKMTDQSWNEFYHRLAETLKHIYSKRTLFGDEKFVDMTGVLKRK
jgi:gamma-glutamyltranspeptidase